MLDAIFAQLANRAASWQEEVEKRRRVSAVDPIADTFDYCASDLRDLVTMLREDLAELTPAQFAQLHHTTPQTVTAWLRAKKLAGRHTARGWLIPATALPPARRRAIRPAGRGR